jgi:hypothetical protein
MIEAGSERSDLQCIRMTGRWSEGLGTPDDDA